jgi:hypothetical protein
MFRSLLVAGGYAIELSLTHHEAVAVGVQLGGVSFLIAIGTAVQFACCASHQMAGGDLPAVNSYPLTIND